MSGRRGERPGRRVGPRDRLGSTGQDRSRRDGHSRPLSLRPAGSDRDGPHAGRQAQPDPAVSHLPVRDRGHQRGGGRRAECKRFKALCREDPGSGAELWTRSSRAYRRRRAALAPAGDPRPEAGIGGPEGPEKASCLHAYAAALLAALSGWFDQAGAAAAAASGRGRGGRCTPPLPRLPGTASCLRAKRCGARTTGAPGGRRSPGGAPGAGRRVAAIDIGTISVRLLVADLRAGRPEQVFRQAEITRLGEGSAAWRCLSSPAARERTAAVVAQIRRGGPAAGRRMHPVAPARAPAARRRTGRSSSAAWGMSTT